MTRKRAATVAALLILLAGGAWYFLFRGGDVAEGIRASGNIEATTVEVSFKIPGRIAERAVDGLTLSVERGEIFGLVGPDGAGKTTTMRLLAAILDPTSGNAWILDHSIRGDAAEVHRLLEEGVTIFVPTAYLDEAERCRRVGLLHQGKFIAVGSPEEVRSLFRGALLEIRCEDPRRAAAVLRQVFPTDAVGLFGDCVHLGTRDPVLPVAAAETALTAAGVPFESVLPIPPSLEDVFISVLGQGGGGGA